MDIGGPGVLERVMDGFLDDEEDVSAERGRQMAFGYASGNIDLGFDSRGGALINDLFADMRNQTVERVVVRIGRPEQVADARSDSPGGVGNAFDHGARRGVGGRLAPGQLAKDSDLGKGGAEFVVEIGSNSRAFPG